MENKFLNRVAIVNMYIIKLQSYFNYTNKLIEPNQNELLILNELYYFGKCTQMEFSRKYGISKQTVNLNVKGLLKKDYIHKVPVEGNKKEKHLIISEEGIECIKRTAKSVNSLQLKAQELYGEEKINVLISLLKDYDEVFSYMSDNNLWEVNANN